MGPRPGCLNDPAMDDGASGIAGAEPRSALVRQAAGVTAQGTAGLHSTLCIDPD